MLSTSFNADRPLYADSEHKGKMKDVISLGVMKQTFHVSLKVFPLSLIIKNFEDQTRGLYQIRPGKANYTDNNLLLYCCRHVSHTKQHIPETCRVGRRATEERGSI